MIRALLITLAILCASRAGAQDCGSTWQNWSDKPWSKSYYVTEIPPDTNTEVWYCDDSYLIGKDGYHNIQQTTITVMVSQDGFRGRRYRKYSAIKEVITWLPVECATVTRVENISKDPQIVGGHRVWQEMVCSDIQLGIVDDERKSVVWRRRK